MQKEVTVLVTPEPAASVCFGSSQDRLGLFSFPSLIDNVESRVVYILKSFLMSSRERRMLQGLLGGEEEAYFCTHATAEMVICWGHTGELPRFWFHM